MGQDWRCRTPIQGERVVGDSYGSPREAWILMRQGKGDRGMPLRTSSDEIVACTPNRCHWTWPQGFPLVIKPYIACSTRVINCSMASIWKKLNTHFGSPYHSGITLMVKRVERVK